MDVEGRCALCRRGFDAAYCLGAYVGALRDVIHLFNYREAPTLAAPLGDLLAHALPRDQRLNCIAPPHWRRRWHRGFNQAEALAPRLSPRAGVRVARALRRIRATETQAGLSDTRRRRNVAQAFRVRRGVVLEGKRILLVEDATTTGLTGAACAAAWKRAGAAKVALLPLARVDRRMDLWQMRTAVAAAGDS